MKILVAHQEVLISDDDCELFSPNHGFHYYVNEIGGKVYVFRQYYYKDKEGNTRKKRVYLHTDVMKVREGMRVRHLDGNPLNNRRDNLVICEKTSRDK